MKILLIAGARPNFMKIKPLHQSLQKEGFNNLEILHTGQHYDANMSDSFFKDLNLPLPDHNLNVGSGTHASQTAQIMIGFENYINKSPPDLVIVVGDVNSTLACSLVCSKKGIKLVHVEAGLRSFNWGMPEEINRVITDRLSDVLFTTDEVDNKNLLSEGISLDKIHLVGDVMIDTLFNFLDKSQKSKILSYNKIEEDFCLVTLHRPSNVDNSSDLERCVNLLLAVSQKINVVFSMHPRTKSSLIKNGMFDSLVDNKEINIIEPCGYLDFLKLISSSRIILTDSGSIQTESSILDVPCITLREDTERPSTITHGTNILVGQNLESAIREVEINLKSPKKSKNMELWDGNAAVRIAKILKAYVS